MMKAEMSRQLEPAGTQTPTLLVFTLGPEAEAHRHPLLPEALRGEETRLRRACLDNVLEAGRAAGCRVVLSSPAPLDVAGADAWSPQHGADFSERFVNAIASAGEGGGRVVVVGADIPGLRPAHVREALDLLAAEPDRVVVGPSLDGGFYLLAVARPIGGVLAEVRWCGGDTRRTLLDGLRAAGRSAVFLEPLEDLDTPADLERWVASGPAPSPGLADQRSGLRRLLALRRRPLDPSREGVRSPVVAARIGRAPPLAFS